MKLPKTTSLQDCVDIILHGLKELEKRDPNHVITAFESKHFIVKTKKS